MLHAARNITHYSQWYTTEDSDTSELIHFIQLKRVDFYMSYMVSDLQEVRVRYHYIVCKKNQPFSVQ